MYIQYTLAFALLNNVCKANLHRMTNDNNLPRYVVLVSAFEIKDLLASGLSLHGNISGDNVTFFKRFPRFLVTLNELEEAEEIISDAATINSKHAGNELSQPVEILLAFYPKSDLSTDIAPIIPVINEANAIYNGTVTTLLINYGPLRLDATTLSIVRQDIETSNRLFPNYNLRSGFIFEPDNCPVEVGSSALEFQRDNLVLFKSARRSDFCLNNNELMYQPSRQGRCFPTKFKADMKFGISFSAEIVVDYQHQIYTYGEELLNQWLPRNVLPVIRIHDQRNTKNNCSILGILGQNETSHFERWLMIPSRVDKQHLGITLSVQDMPLLENLNIGTTVVQTFRKIVIHFQRDTVDNGRLLLNLAKNSCNYTSHDNLSVEILSVVDVDEGKSNESMDFVRETLDIVKEVNQVCHGIVTTFFVKINFCQEANFCGSKDVHNMGREQLEEESERFFYNRLQMLKFVENLKDLYLTNADKIKFGLVLTEDTIPLLYSLDGNYLGPVVKNILESTDIFLYPYTMAAATIQESGGISALNVMDTAWEKSSPRAYVNHRKSVIAEEILWLNIIGCHKDPMQMTSYVKFLELLNAGLKEKNENVVLMTAFEYHQENRDKLNTCGWWIAERVTRSPDGNVTIQDKKLVLWSDLRQRSEQPKQPDVDSDHKWETTNYKAIFHVVLLPATFFVFLVTLLMFFYVLYYRPKYFSLKNDGQHSSEGTEGKLLNTKMKLGSGFIKLPSYDKKKYEVRKSSYTVDMRKCLGYGKFTIVYPGKIKRPNETYVEVAVKVNRNRGGLRNSDDRLALLGLISETKVLSHLGEHKHIVKMEAASTRDLKKGNVMVFLERCHLGPLRQYLLSCRPQERGQTSTVLIESPYNMSVDRCLESLGEELLADMLRWTTEIASGMEYLALKKVVHADLTARNVLLNAEKCAKITDFGLARRLYDFAEHVKEAVEPLSWKWMAPESLQNSIFTEKSDVWAFGVTLWEIFTLGGEPYVGQSWNDMFPLMLKNGLRLPEPRYKIDSVYVLMKQCWDRAPGGRPAFSQLELLLRDEYLSFLGRFKGTDRVET